MFEFNKKINTKLNIKNNGIFLKILIFFLVKGIPTY